MVALGPLAVLAQLRPDTARVSLPYTNEYQIRSRVNGRTYRLAVAFPPDYAARGDDTTRYRVLYVLDGNDEFPLAVEAHRLRRVGLTGPGTGRWPDIIIVGIGYPVDLYWDTMDFRNDDYTPTRLSAPQPECGAYGRRPTGGGPAFLHVLRDEIVPFIDTHYRTVPDRGIMGHSLGGLFAFYALLTAPELFQRYAALSPSLWFDREMMLGVEARAASKGNGLKATVFVAAGSLEIPCILEPMHRMVDSLRAHKYAGLDVQHQVFPDEGHMSVLPAAVGRSLQALGYDPPPPAAPPTPRRP
ncbi:MAG TPA: alpha/beta hydrolase-fold protein [Gemmatimonadaceae bacterium]|nr:alpha/beta hydrolase-fold protein [Gemmatimonadaceae bacterium]